MPYDSLAQEGLFHSKNSPVSKKVVKEFDRATKGMKLPKRVTTKPAAHAGKRGK